MSRPSKHGRIGHSFGSETTTSVITSPPTSPKESHGGSRRLFGAGGVVIAHGDPVHHPMYFVQSPSRDSFTFNEGDSLSQSFAAKSSPGNSPLASPLHKSFASKPHQVHDAPSSYQTSNNPRPGSRRVLPQPSNTAPAHEAPDVRPDVHPNVRSNGHFYPGAAAAATKKGFQPWTSTAIQEDDERQYQWNGKKGLSRWCIVFLSVFFAVFCAVIVGLVYWLVCRPSAPKVQVKGIKFQNFFIAAGNDPSGVPTQLLSVNCTTTLHFENPSKYFGFHVSAPEAHIYYQQIRVADGKSVKFFQKKKSTGFIFLNVHAVRTPVYGAGPNLLSEFISGDGLSLQLRIGVQSQAFVIWEILAPKYKSNIACVLVLDTNSTIANNSASVVKISSQNCHHG